MGFRTRFPAKTVGLRIFLGFLRTLTAKRPYEHASRHSRNEKTTPPLLYTRAIVYTHLLTTHVYDFFNDDTRTVIGTLLSQLRDEYAIGTRLTSVRSPLVLAGRCGQCARSIRQCSNRTTHNEFLRSSTMPSFHVDTDGFVQAHVVNERTSRKTSKP